MKRSYSPTLALLLLACAGAVGQERQAFVSTLNPEANRLAPGTSASVRLEAVRRGREFLANLLDPDLGLLPEYRGANVYWLFHRVYKLALALIAAERLSATADLPQGLLDRLLALQADSGGWITDYHARGERIGQANVETTCLAILGLEAVNLRAVPAAVPVADPASHLPNILFILADDLGYGDVGCYNTNSRIPTPNLDRFATQGMRFTDAHAPASVCSPTRYALLTGRYAWRSRLQRGVLAPWDKPLIEPGRLTVGSLLQQHGYVTACIGKWHLGWSWPTQDGKPAAAGSNRLSNVAFTQPIADGPTTRGFDYYFGTDVPNYPPYCL